LANAKKLPGGNKEDNNEKDRQMNIGANIGRLIEREDAIRYVSMID
jgi:hypothetical protein